MLDQVQRMVASAGTDTGAGRTADGSQWVAWSKIHGPGWFQIYLLPQSRINHLLMWGLGALFCIGIAGLLPAMWLLRRRVRRRGALDIAAGGDDGAK